MSSGSLPRRESLSGLSNTFKVTGAVPGRHIVLYNVLHKQNKKRRKDLCRLRSEISAKESEGNKKNKKMKKVKTAV